MEKHMTQMDVLIVGAGPTGLVLALWLTKLGVRVRIVDKTAEPGTTSRALAVQARTLELYRQIGLAGALVERGGRAVAAVEVERRTELVGFEDAGGRVIARLKRLDGVGEACDAAYIAGCDGAHS